MASDRAFREHQIRALDRVLRNAVNHLDEDVALAPQISEPSRTLRLEHPGQVDRSTNDDGRRHRQSGRRQPCAQAALPMEPRRLDGQLGLESRLDLPAPACDEAALPGRRWVVMSIESLGETNEPCPACRQRHAMKLVSGQVAVKGIGPTSLVAGAVSRTLLPAEQFYYCAKTESLFQKDSLLRRIVGVAYLLIMFCLMLVPTIAAGYFLFVIARGVLSGVEIEWTLLGISVGGAIVGVLALRFIVSRLRGFLFSKLVRADVRLTERLP
jgi:hypothetical protein